MMRTPEIEITSLSLVMDYTDIDMVDAGMMITSALTDQIDPVHLANTIGSASECNQNNQYITRSKELYKITEYENRTSRLVSESNEYFIIACDILESMNVHCSLDEICLELVLYNRLEDIAQLYTKESPDVALNELMFIKRDINAHNSSRAEFKFIFRMKDFERDSITSKFICDSIESCKAVYLSSEKLENGKYNNNFTIVKKDDIVKIDFNENILSLIKCELDDILDKLNTNFLLT